MAVKALLGTDWAEMCAIVAGEAVVAAKIYITLLVSAEGPAAAEVRDVVNADDLLAVVVGDVFVQCGKSRGKAQPKVFVLVFE